MLDRSPLRVTLSEDRRRAILETLQRFWLDEFDEELSTYRAERLLGWFVKALGAPVYNQAIQDARAFFQEKLDDLDVEFHEPEEESP